MELTRRVMPDSDLVRVVYLVEIYTRQQFIVVEYEGEHPMSGFVMPKSTDPVGDDYATAEEILNNYVYCSATYSRLQRSNVRHTKPLLNYKDYRKCDVSHINRLTSLTRNVLNENQVDDPHIGQIQMIVGHAILPGGFILATDISKSIDPSKYDRKLGVQYVNEGLTEQVDAKLWDYEGYRLYRNLMSLDNIIANEPNATEADMAISRIANGALAVVDAKREWVYLVQFGFHYHPVFIGSNNQLYPGISTISYEGYLRALAILDSYVELH